MKVPIIEPIRPDGTICLHPIGKAGSPILRQQAGGFEEVECIIELEPEFEDYLGGMDQYSHIMVLFWMHEQTQPKAITRPQGNPAVPEVGMFACR